MIARLWGGPLDGTRHRMEGIEAAEAAPAMLFFEGNRVVYWLDADTIRRNQHGLHARYRYEEDKQG